MWFSVCPRCQHEKDQLLLLVQLMISFLLQLFWCRKAPAQKPWWCLAMIYFNKIISLNNSIQKIVCEILNNTNVGSRNPNQIHGPTLMFDRCSQAFRLYIYIYMTASNDRKSCSRFLWCIPMIFEIKPNEVTNYSCLRSINRIIFWRMKGMI